VLRRWRFSRPVITSLLPRRWRQRHDRFLRSLGL